MCNYTSLVVRDACDNEPIWISVYTTQTHVFESKRKISIIWNCDFLAIAFSKMSKLAFWK